MTLLTPSFPYLTIAGTQRDGALWAALAALWVIGGLTFFSSALAYSTMRFDNPYQLPVRHAVFLWMGLFVMYAVQWLPATIWRRYRTACYLSGVALLIAVLIPGVGLEVNYAQRWLSLAGFTFQPSEWMKFAFILFLAGYIEKFSDTIKTKSLSLIRAVLFLTTIVAVLLMLEPDFGSTVEIMFLAMGMMFVSGAPLLGFFLFAVVIVVVATSVLFLAEYRVNRVLSFLNPWEDPFGSGYNLTQSLMSIGRGEWFGVGIGNGVHKLGYLPEVHTDFVFTVLAEETGLMGAAIVILLFAIVVWRMLRLAATALAHHLTFMAMVVVGVALWLFFQVFVSIAGSIQLLPPKGLVLPFFSYGGSFTLVFSLAIGVVIRFERAIYTDIHTHPKNEHTASRPHAPSVASTDAPTRAPTAALPPYASS